MRKLATDKNRYQIWLHTYLKRREEMRWLYSKAAYPIKAKHINNKIKTFKKAIQRIEEREQRIKKYHRFTTDFFGVNILTLSKQCKNKRHVLARYCFCKVCIEHKITSVQVADFLDVHKGTPLRIRKTLTKSFLTEKDNREIYHKFLKFVEDASSSK